MAKIDYYDSIKFFQGNPDMWEPFIERLKQMREDCFADLKRIYNSPETTEDKCGGVIGRITAFDDIIYELTTTSEEVKGDVEDT